MPIVIPSLSKLGKPISPPKCGLRQRYYRVMEPPIEFYQKLHEIDTWAKGKVPLPPLTGDTDFMELALELMNYTRFILGIGMSLAPDQKRATQGYTRNRAIIVGHVVRIMKLYDALTLHVSKDQAEICLIFQRLILETVNRMEYLLKRGRRDSFRSFILTSYKPEKEMLADLTHKAAVRELIPIEVRMLNSVRRKLASDRITHAQLRANKRWDLDGKKFRELLADLGRDWAYAYGFGMGSHWVHGDWLDIKLNHLERHGRYYIPSWRYAAPDPRIVCPTTLICLWALIRFIKWSRVDPDRFITPIVRNLCTVAELLDTTHESFLVERRKKARA